MQCFTIGFGAIIGTGWLIVLGSWLDQAGPMGAILAFAAGGLLMMSVGLCYAEMATMIPASGGEVAYAYEVFGVGTSFAAGWVLALVYISMTAFEGISAAWLIGALVPGSEGPVLYTILGAPVRLSTLLIGIGGTAGLAYLNYRGIQFAAGFQDLFTWALIVLSLVFFAAGMMLGHTANLEPLFRESVERPWWSGVLSIFVTTAFWYTGFNMIPQAMEEVAPGTSARKVAWAMLLSIATAIAFYCLVILSSALASPWQDLLKQDLPVAAAFRAALGSSVLAKVVLLSALFGIVTTWNPLILSGSRILFALGRARVIDPRFGTIHPRFGTPSTAVVFASVLACIGVLLGRSAILPIVNVGAIAMAMAFAITCFGVARLRRTSPERPRPYRAPGGMGTALIGALSSVFMVVFAIYQPYADAKGRFPTEWAVVIGWALLGALFWVFARGVRGRLDERERRALIVGTSEGVET